MNAQMDDKGRELFGTYLACGGGDPAECGKLWERMSENSRKTWTSTAQWYAMQAATAAAICRSADDERKMVDASYQRGLAEGANTVLRERVRDLEGDLARFRDEIVNAMGVATAARDMATIHALVGVLAAVDGIGEYEPAPPIPTPAFGDYAALDSSEPASKEE